jgi:hypothetical protein
MLRVAWHSTTKAVLLASSPPYLGGKVSFHLICSSYIANNHNVHDQALGPIPSVIPRRPMPMGVRRILYLFLPDTLRLILHPEALNQQPVGSRLFLTHKNIASVPIFVSLERDAEVGVVWIEMCRHVQSSH